MNFYDVLAAEKWDGGIPTINFFDLLFAQSMGGGEEWAVYEGALPATLNANGADLRQYQVWGNTGGVGEEVDITGVSEPLCGIGTYTDSLDLSTGILTRRIKKLVLTGTDKDGNSNVTAQGVIFITPMTKLKNAENAYCTHFKYVNQNQGSDMPSNSFTTSGGAGISLWFKTNYASVADFKSYLAAQYAAGTPVTVWYVLSEPEVSTITVPSGLAGTLEGYLIQDGTPTPETPIYPTANGVKQADNTYSIMYSYKLDMVSRTRNLFPSAAEQTITLNGVTATCDGKGKYTFTGTTTNNTAIHFNLIKTSLIPKSVGQGGQGTFSIFNTKMFSGDTKNFASLSLTLQETPIYSWSLNAINKKSDSYTIMGEKNIDGISFYFAGGVATNFSASPMITDNGELPATYEPYSNTTTPIYIGNEPLWAVNNYADYTDYQKQKVIRAIKKYVLTGNENWEEITGAYASRKYFRYVFEIINYCVRHVCISSHFTQTNITTATTTVGFDVFDSTSAGGEVLAIRPSGVQSTTLENFKAWLAEQYAAGTPVTVWCALTVAEEADPPVPLPALPTCEGTTVIDYAGQSVAPEKVYLEYQGGK